MTASQPTEFVDAPHPVDPLVGTALAVITGNLGARLTPSGLAAAVGVSPQHLNRLFRRAFGITALQYVTHLRMVRAAVLLDRSDDTVRAIARRVGYDDPYHFSRVFTRYHGLSPAHWRDHHNPVHQIHCEFALFDKTCDRDIRL